MMKFPSIEKLLEGFGDVMKRFPMEMVAALVGTISAMILIESDYTQDTNSLIRLLLCANLGLVLFLSASVLGESRNFTRQNQWILKGLILLVLAGIFFLLDPIAEEVNIFRFGFLVVGFHMLVSFAPFILRGSVDGFWEYNKQLFIRILTAGLYSSVLYGGLAIAILSTDALFSLHIKDEIYGHLFCVVFGVFNTAFFLAGIPSDWKALETNQDYPKGLKIFTQYVLIPLATVYLSILLAYELKLIAEWSLPKGLVSSLVLGYAVYGILSNLLVYPIRFDDGNRWIMTFSKLFYLLLIPLIILLGIAVYIRIENYGITESRYILIVLSLWLVGITAYFLSSRKQNIKVIPVSLFLVCLISVVGPQSASSVSQRSQLKRLIQFFESKGAFNNGKITPLTSNELSGQGYTTARFIVDRYGADPLEKYLTIDVDSLFSETDSIKSSYSRKYEQSSLILYYLFGDGYISIGEDVGYFTGHADHGQNPIAIDGYAHMIKFVYYPDTDSVKNLLTLNRDSLTFTFDLTHLFDTVINRSTTYNRYVDLPPHVLSAADTEDMARVYLENVHFRKENDGYFLQSCDGYLLIRRK